MNTRYLPNPFRPDLRSLAVFRVLAALCFIGSFGAVSTGASHIFGPLAISGIHGVWAALILASALMLLIGYRTRFFCLLLWASLSLPAWIDPQAMREVFLWKILFFWSLFLPLSSRLSIDSALDLDSHQEIPKEVTPGTIGFALHFIILLFTHASPVLWLWLAAWIPAELWPLVKNKIVSRESIRIFYDGDCGFCKRMTLILKTYLLIPLSAIRPAQEIPEIAEQMERENSWVVLDGNGQAHYKFDAFLVVLSQLHLTFPLIVLLRIQAVSDLGLRAYNHVSSHRGGYSRMTAWLSWRPLEKSLTQVQTYLAAAALFILAALLIFPNTGIIRLPAFLLGFIAS
ncbi:MAG: DUF393 domain-containing protein [Candidatus Omnitrophica bacterium]|nr:DUF393 domain-containing protein [Candidatus Omnitrophota bacterium]